MQCSKLGYNAIAIYLDNSPALKLTEILRSPKRAHGRATAFEDLPFIGPVR